MNSKHSIIVGLCVKNNENGLPKVFENISKMRQIFEKTFVVIYYDHSEDNSLELLKSLCEKYKLQNIIINEDNEYCTSNIRIRNISNARNSILHFINNEENNDYDLFCMMDCSSHSCQGNINIKLLNNCVNKKIVYNRWDCLSFARKPYYDLASYSDNIFQIGYRCYPKTVTSKEFTTSHEYKVNMIRRINNTIFLPENKGKLIKVDSAFCGFALYKKEKFKGCSYNGLLSLSFMDKELLKKNITTFKIQKINNGIINPEDSEHKHFHMMAKKRNNARIMVACADIFD
jgi:hypothetical protein